jgi:hypothetical protein
MEKDLYKSIRIDDLEFIIYKLPNSKVEELGYSLLDEVGKFIQKSFDTDVKLKDLQDGLSGDQGIIFIAGVLQSLGAVDHQKIKYIRNIFIDNSEILKDGLKRKIREDADFATLGQMYEFMIHCIAYNLASFLDLWERKSRLQDILSQALKKN